MENEPLSIFARSAKALVRTRGGASEEGSLLP